MVFPVKPVAQTCDQRLGLGRRRKHTLLLLAARKTKRPARSMRRYTVNESRSMSGVTTKRLLPLSYVSCTTGEILRITTYYACDKSDEKREKKYLSPHY